MRFGVQILAIMKFGSRYLLHLFPYSQLSYDEYTDLKLAVGRWDGEGEDWPPALICRGYENEVANTSWLPYGG